MKKYLRYADVFVLFSGSAGVLLRLLLLLGGTDGRDLYPKNHPAWIILCILSVAVVAMLYLLTRQPGTDNRYKKNFPASIAGAIGCGVAAIGIAITAFRLLNSELLNIICFLLGLAAAAGLALAAFCRFTGKQPHFACHAAPAAFFAIRLFLLGKELGSEPEVCRYLFEMLASLALVPTCYQLWAFDVDMGKREKCLFWTLTAAYLCIVAIVGMENWLLYLTCAVWLLTNLCPLKFLARKKRHQQDIPQETAEPAAETEVAAPVAAEPAPAPAEPAPADPETSDDPLGGFDAEAILAEILSEIDKSVE